VTQPRSSDVGRAARWLLLLSTVFGLAMMHTLGHAGMQMADGGQPGTARNTSSMSISVATTAGDIVTAVSPMPCAGDGCGHHGAMDGWSVCLAILGGLAVIVLVAALLRLRRSRGDGPGAAPADLMVPRGPPPWPAGLRATSTVVLRI
jgi:hypothetical protein